MGLPEINIEFKAKAETAVKRSQNGIVAVILADDTKSGAGNESYIYQSASDSGLSSSWTTTNRRFLNLVFAASPKKVLVERISTKDTDYSAALARLKNKKWNWLTIPGIEDKNVASIVEWITAQRQDKKTFKAVLPNSASNDPGIVNFTTTDIVCGAYVYTTAQYCARIAGLLASLALSETATYQVLSDVTSITESTDPDADIDAGKLILINDGEKIKIGSGVNSLHTLSSGQTEDMKQIKIIDGMDLIRDDIRTTFEENYIGQINSHVNKLLFVNAVNQYFKRLATEGVLYDEATNEAYIDVDAQRAYLETKYDVSDMTDEEIEVANTGTYVFVAANVTMQGGIENLNFTISLE